MMHRFGGSRRGVVMGGASWTKLHTMQHVGEKMMFEKIILPKTQNTYAFESSVYVDDTKIGYVAPYDPLFYFCVIGVSVF